MSTPKLLAWLAFAYVALIGLRYLLGMRTYLACALREIKVWPATAETLTPAQRRVLPVFDAELAAAGFTHLGFGHHTSLLTYHAAPQTISVFVNPDIPAYAVVRRSAAPEDGRPALLSLTTELPDGTALESVTSHLSKLLPPPGVLRVQEYPGVAVSDLVKRHTEQVNALRGGAQLSIGATLEDGLQYVTMQVRRLREAWRERRWVTPTPDPQLDRFTLRGAFAFTSYSMRVARGQAGLTVQATPIAAPAEARAIRLEAELDAVLSVAETPERAPGTPWPLLTLIGATAAASFVAMSLLWTPLVALLILGVIAFHEAGHAVAMRLMGYRDVHVFFVPLLGAMTVGNTSTTTVRNQIGMLLAGPVPGLWLAVVSLLVNQAIGPIGLLRATALALLLINAFNLLPVTPFDGGRALELLSRPESVWRLAIHAASIVGLLALAVVLKDSVVTVLAIFWAVLLPQQWLGYRLRRSVAQAVTDRSDYRSVVRAALEVMATPRFGKWRSLTRQATARMLAKQFSQPQATTGDRALGIAGYLTAWVPLLIAAVLWRA
jgi:Zn-dependent protease